MFFKQNSTISTSSGKPLILVDQSAYFNSNILSTERGYQHIAKAWIAMDWLLIIWKSNLSNKMKWNFFWVIAMSILVYGRTTWMLTKHMKEKLIGNYTKMVQAVLNKSWKEQPKKQQLYSNLLSISQTI